MELHDAGGSSGEASSDDPGTEADQADRHEALVLELV